MDNNTINQTLQGATPAEYHFTTVSKTILADLYTPVGVYLRLRDLYPQSVLMESSDYHGVDDSRSFIGLGPIASVAIGHGEAVVSYPDGRELRRQMSRDYTADKAIHDLTDHLHVEGDDANYFGIFGYTSFNSVRYFEGIAIKDETQLKNDAPDMLYILYKTIIVFDHHNNLLKLVTLDDAAGLETVLRAMSRGDVRTYDFHPLGEATSTLSDEEHKANIRRGIDHCLRGDVFQIVLSRRFIQRGRRFQTLSCLAKHQPQPLSVLLRFRRLPHLRLFA